MCKLTFAEHYKAKYLELSMYVKSNSTASIKYTWELNVDYIAAKSLIMEALGGTSKQQYTHRWLKGALFAKSLPSQM